jgi:alpha-L-rhamnosidase
VVLAILTVAGFSSVSLSGEIISTAHLPNLAVRSLRCEYKTNPLGIDVPRPRLSWIITSVQRGQRQSAYRILAATSPDKLAPGKADLWDSGKVESDQTAEIEYNGTPLQSRMCCYWQVQVWGLDPNTTALSESAFWTMGLLQQTDFKGEWIGLDDCGYDAVTNAEKKIDEDFKKAKWIAFPNSAAAPPTSEWHFAKIIDIPADRKIRKAMCVLIGDNRVWLWVNGRESLRGRDPKTAGRGDITDSLRPGRNYFVIRLRHEGNSEPNQPIPSVIGAFRIEFEDSDPIVFVTDKTFKAIAGRPSDWTSPDFTKDCWVDANETGPLGIEPWGDVTVTFAELYLPPPRYLRKEFKVTNPVKRATLYASALGLYEMHINGRRIGDDYFTPGWSDYNKRVYYNTYDVTGLVKQGDNAIAAILADGWYAGYLGSGRRRARYSQKTRLFAQLEIEYADGGSEIVASDGTWKALTGPIYEADFQMGQAYDARKEMPGWDKPLYQDSHWKPVAAEKTIKGKLAAYPGVPVGIFREIKPVSVTEPQPGRFVFDMGTNFAGVVRLKVNGEAGRKIVLRFGERLNPDGTVYVTNLRLARAIDTYICKGDGQEIWQPQFTYHGFQYVELTGYPGKPGPDAITGIELASRTPPAGHFTCSDKTANKLYKNICQTQRANFIDIPTDCPQRDERLGWTGDAQIFVRAAAYNYDIAAFYTKWLIDLHDAQHGDGAYPDVAPSATRRSGGTAAWADAGIICPWTLYQMYGDRRVLEEYYEPMTRWIQYCTENSKNLIRPDKGYGDWLSVDANTAKDVLGTAYFAHSTDLMARIAEALGKDNDAIKYRQLFAKIKQAFNRGFVAEDGRIKSDTQTAYVLALAFDLLLRDKKALAQKHLIDDIEKRGWHLSTGFVGTKDLLQTLTDIGRIDIAYQLFQNKTFPSWGFSLDNGATSIWEHWDGWTPDKGFQDPKMNSFLHCAFGAVADWMFKTIGGIDTNGPGFKDIIIRPRPAHSLTSARVSYCSIRGTITADWRLNRDTLMLNVTIPANTTATVYIPTGSPDKVTESGKPVQASQGVTFLKKDHDNCIYRIASGSYYFTAEDVKPIQRP